MLIIIWKGGNSMAGEQRICPVCGKVFENKRRKYCTPECTRKANKKKAVEYSRKEYGKMKRKRQAERKELEKSHNAPAGDALQKVAGAAKEAGMTYGQYVGMLYSQGIETK